MMDAQQNRDLQAQTYETGETEIDLLGLFYRMLEKWKPILLCAIIGLAVSAVYTYKLVTPVYEATSKMYVMNSADSIINLSDLQIGSYLASDYMEVFKTWEVHERVIENLGLDCTVSQMQNMLKITNPSDTRMICVTVASPDPDLAMNAANEYFTVAKEYTAKTMGVDKLSAFSYAQLPLKPVKPKKALNMAIGIILGTAVAMACVLVQFILDDRIKTEDDIEKYGDMPTLALVPDVEDLDGSGTNGKKRSRRNERSNKKAAD